MMAGGAPGAQMLTPTDQDGPRGRLFRSIPSSALIGLALAFMASETCARARFLPAGPEWYADDNGLWRSIRDDWRYLGMPHGKVDRRRRAAIPVALT
jgi:hypothetical protein